MIKRYLEFILENNNSDDLGKQIESLFNDEYIKNLVIKYTKDIDPSIKLSNAINSLDINIKNDLKKQVDDYLKNGLTMKNPEVNAYVDITKQILSGKGVFTSFLKALTALGKKDIQSNLDDCPDDFLFIFTCEIPSNDVKQIFNRFKSLVNYIDKIDYTKDITKLYFGVKNNNLEYGFLYEELIPIGSFKLNTQNLKWISQLQNKSAYSLKKEIVNLTMNDMILLNTIKDDMKSFDIGFHENKMNPFISDKIISFGYYGCGKWDDGKLDEDELLNIKNKLKSFILSKKWKNKITYKINASSFWLYIYIKIK